MADAAAMPVGSGDVEFRELADNAPVMIWRAGTDKACDWFNKPWLDFVGRPMENEIGFGWAEHIHPSDAERCLRTYTEAFDRRERFSVAYRLKNADGQYRHMLDNGGPFYRNGEFAGYFGSCLDITLQHSSDAQQKTLFAELQHRVKNNLQLILGFLTLQTSRVESPEAKAVLQETAKRIHGIGAVQERLAGGFDGEKVDLAMFLPQLVGDILGADQGRIVLTSSAETVLTSASQASAIGLMVNEITVNSLKHAFRDEGYGTLHLRVRRIEDHVEISLADSGPGFPEAMLGPSPAPGYKRGLLEGLARKAGTLTRSNDPGAHIVLKLKVGC